MNERDTTLLLSLLSAPVAVALIKVLEIMVRRWAPTPRPTPLTEAMDVVELLQSEVERLHGRVLELERQLAEARAHIWRLESERGPGRSGPRPRPPDPHHGEG